MKVKKTLSLEDTVITKGEEKAKRLSFNFSSYVTYLINKDCGEMQGIEVSIDKEPVKKLSKEVSGSIDDIMNLNDVEM